MKKWDNGALYATEKDVMDDDARIVVVKTYSISDDVYHDTYVSFPNLYTTDRDAAINYTIDKGMKLSYVLENLNNAKHHLKV